MLHRNDPSPLRPILPGDQRERVRVFARDAADEVRIIGLKRSIRHDVYYRALRLSWPRFIAVMLGFFLAENLFFALLYMVQPSGISEMQAGSFAQAFFFSVQTLATIGYGRWAPVSLYANLVVTMETAASVLTLAVFTGLTFARFSRPTSQIVFSRNAVVTHFNGKPMLMFRLANQRLNQILQAEATVSILRDEHTPEGYYFRKLYDLKLVRSRTPVFGLSFLVMHVLDETSPLHGCTPESLARNGVELVVVVSGLDDTTLQTVNARHSYDASEILFHRRFADMFGYAESGMDAMDYRRFHETVPEPSAGA